MNFDFKNPTTGEKIELPESIVLGEGDNSKELNLKELLFSVIEKSNEDARSQGKPKLNALEQQVKELNEKFNLVTDEKKELERAKMSDLEKQQADFEDMQTKVESANLASQQNFDRFKNTKLKNDIMNALSKVDGVRNAENVVKLLTMDAEMIQDGDNYQTVMSINGEKRSIDNAVSDWFKKDGNDIYLTPSLGAGGGTTQTTASSNNTQRLEFTRELINSDPQAKKEYREALMSNKNPVLRE